MEEFKGNSNASKKKESEEKQLKPVTSNVVVKQESEVKKMAKQFFNDNAKNVGTHVVTDVLIPGMQKLVSDMIKNAIDWILWGTSKKSSGSSGVGNVSYSSYYNRTPATGYSQPQQTRNDIYSVNDVTFNDRGEAEQVLASMKEQIVRYGMVSVSDFYDLISYKSNYTDNKYGWRDLSQAEVIRFRDGFSIRFPKIVPLE